MKRKIVTVFGSSKPSPGEPAYEIARELGHGIATAGWTLCNGGYGGTMEASAKGACEANGHTIGVTCTALNSRGGPNQYVKQEIPTFYLITRLDTLVRLGNAYVVLPGGTGTLLEIALVWELLNKRILRRNAPIVLIGDHWHPLLDPIRREQPGVLELQLAPDPKVALDMLAAHFEAPAPD